MSQGCPETHELRINAELTRATILISMHDLVGARDSLKRLEKVMQFEEALTKHLIKFELLNGYFESF